MSDSNTMSLREEQGDFGLFGGIADGFGKILSAGAEKLSSFGNVWADIELSKILSQQVQDPNRNTVSEQEASKRTATPTTMSNKTIIIAGISVVGVVALFLLAGRK